MEAVLGAILGGALTILGGMLVARTTDRNERRKVHLAQIEAIHAVATEVLAWSEAGMQQVMVAPAGQWDLERMKIRPPTERLALLTNIYEPAMAPVVQRLLESVDEQRSAAFDFYGALARFPVDDASIDEQGDDKQGDGALVEDEGGDEQALEESFERVSSHHDALRGHFDELERRLVSAARRRAGQ